jgi:stress-induced morphogen
LRLFSAINRCSSFRSAVLRPRHSARAPQLLSVRAMESEGQINSELIDRMRGKIATALDAARVEVTDMQGDGRHVEIMVVAKSFEGQSAVNRQRMVYKVGGRL